MAKFPLIAAKFGVFRIVKAENERLYGYGKKVNDKLIPWLKLAALATATTPNLTLVELTQPQFATDDYQLSNAMDADGKSWTIVASRTPAYALALEKQLRLLNYLNQQTLAFAVPKPAGFGRFGESLNIMVYPSLEGSEPDEFTLSSSGFGTEIAKCIAQIHRLSAAAVIRCDLPAYNSNQIRNQYLDDLKLVSDTEFVPKALREHWLEALQEGPLWDFTTTVVHGSLEPHCLLTRAGSITAITDFSSTQVGDPATDLAWLCELNHFDKILQTYLDERGETDDPHLAERCELVSELAALRWLAHGHNSSQQWIVADAQQMLAVIAEKYLPAEPISFPVDQAATDAITTLEPAPVSDEAVESPLAFADDDDAPATDLVEVTPLFEEDKTVAIEVTENRDSLA